MVRVEGAHRGAKEPVLGCMSQILGRRCASVFSRVGAASAGYKLSLQPFHPAGDSWIKKGGHHGVGKQTLGGDGSIGMLRA